MDKVHVLQVMGQEGSDPSNERLDFRPGGFWAPSLHQRSQPQAILREQRELRFTFGGGVFAVKEGFLPVLDSVGENWLRKD